jgi:hypothetical protein
VYEPSATVGHAHDLDLTDYWRQHFSYGRGAGRYHSHGAIASLRVESSFHTTLPAAVYRRLRGEPLVRSAHLSMLLVAWQLANLAGFVFEKARRPTGPATTDPR